MGPITNPKHYPYVVTDDGLTGHRYSVRVIAQGDDANNPSIFIGSGMSPKNAAIVAESLKKSAAGTDSSILTEGKRFD